eukprot:g39878.t1
MIRPMTPQQPRTDLAPSTTRPRGGLTSPAPNPRTGSNMTLRGSSPSRPDSLNHGSRSYAPPTPRTQKLKWEDLSQKCWSEAVQEHLQGCLKSWTVFKTSVENLDKYATTVTDFISKCMETVYQRDATVKKVRQHLFFLRLLRKFVMSIRSLTNFYRCTIES